MAYHSILSGQQIDNFESRIANLESNNISQLGAVATEDIVPLSKGGTGINANEASDVRVALGLGAASVYDVIPIANGGTGISANSVTDIRTGLGLGTMATQNADNYISKSILSGAYDILYSSAANIPTRLSANITTTKKILTMTGTGTTGSAPVWDVLTASDIGLGNVQNIDLSTWTGNTSINSIGTLSTGEVPWSLITGAPSASTSGVGLVSLTDAINSTSVTTAATPNSVKTTYDLANAALPKSGGVMSGAITPNSNGSINFGSSSNK